MDDYTATKDLADPVLLSKIDKFFELGIGEYVALPQARQTPSKVLLVVGDQSSGKSSVLEGLTGLPYPRDSGLCTRFATQITFRRNPSSKISVSLIAAEDAAAEYADKLRAWRKDDLVALEPQAFADILKEAQELMGLIKSEGTATEAKKTFADDFLKIEICGPSQQHLSVIDVPGIFKKTTPGLTNKTDMAMVRNMVKSYMQNPRSVILAVIPANVDIATQEILDMAEECDDKGQRTLGVLTKPDLVDKGAEQAVIDIIDGKSHPLNLGWCIVRNPGQQALADGTVDRYVAENMFFKTESPWNTVARDRLGIEALRTRLVEILAEMIKREFPRVKAEISQKLKFSKAQLETLGPSRATKDQKFQYLLGLSNRFQTVTGLALMAHYSGDEVFDSRDSSGSLKLATAVVNRNATFAEDIVLRGHTMAFENDGSDAFQPPASFGQQQQRSGGPANFANIPPSAPKSSLPSTGSLPSAGLPSANPKPPKDMSDVMDSSKRIRYLRDYVELEDIIFPETMIPLPKPIGYIKVWLESVYKSSRGFELGTFDASMLPIFWRKQSANWDALALGYISDVVSIVHAFIEGLLHAICKDERVLRGISDVLLDPLMERYKKSLEQTKFILSVERSGTPLTTNHYFTDNLEKSRNARTRAQLQKNAFWDQTQQCNVVMLDAVLSSKSNASNEKQTIEDLHDILKAYYKVARKRFVDTICMQAADFHLVTGPDSPAKVFSPTFVGSLTEDQLEAIAGEDLLTKRKRMELKRKIENLELGKKIALT